MHTNPQDPSTTYSISELWARLNLWSKPFSNYYIKGKLAEGGGKSGRERKSISFCAASTLQTAENKHSLAQWREAATEQSNVNGWLSTQGPYLCHLGIHSLAPLCTNASTQSQGSHSGRAL